MKRRDFFSTGLIAVTAPMLGVEAINKELKPPMVRSLVPHASNVSFDFIQGLVLMRRGIKLTIKYNGEDLVCFLDNVRNRIAPNGDIEGGMVTVINSRGEKVEVDIPKFIKESNKFYLYTPLL